MHVDTPATVAVLGAGPIGLEAALYARYLGYTVDVYERDRVGEHLQQFGHVRLFSPFGMNASPLGVAALAAQDAAWHPPDDLALLTAAEYVQQYLLPLAQSDLLAGNVHEQTEVLFVGRESLRKSDRPGSKSRAQQPFRLLLRDAEGREFTAAADVVIDATGNYGNPNWAGAGGIPALGERRLRKQAARQKRNERLIEYGLPDIAGKERKHFAGKKVLVIGSGYSAATNVLALLELAKREDRGEIVWVTRLQPAEDQQGSGPIPRIPGDPLAERDRIAAAANAAVDSSWVQHLPGWLVESFEPQGDSLRVRLVQALPVSTDDPDADLIEADDADDELEESVGTQGGELDHGAADQRGEPSGREGQEDDDSPSREVMEIVVDRVLANVGFRPDRGLYRELQLHECYASEGPMKLAAVLLGEASGDCLAQPSGGPQALLNPEPNFYVLGAKSYGRTSKFLMAQGLDQIRDLFRIVGGREGLDDYRTMGRGR